MSLRLAGAVVAALCVNLLLFALMQRLVMQEHRPLEPRERYRVLDFIRFQPQPKPPKISERAPPLRPVRPRQPPPRPEIPLPQPSAPRVERPRPPVLDVQIPFHLVGVPFLADYGLEPQLGIAENLAPLVRIEPQYPRRAMLAGIEGAVTVEFTIAADGSVKDPVVTDADPPNVFDRAVLRAVGRWKFRPPGAEGRARQVIQFRLNR
jgi:protein TonB